SYPTEFSCSMGNGLTARATTPARLARGRRSDGEDPDTSHLVPTSFRRPKNDILPLVEHWFDEARFGMFVHWTHIANRGYELSWPLVGGVTAIPYAGNVTVDDYYSRALDFCPEPGAAKEWMRLAADAGMRYAVLTTKHHDGFAMW